MEATSILPPEGWSVILEKLPLQEAYHCTLACKLFDQLLEGKRDTITSALTLPILMEKFQHLDVSWRTVCKDWKQTLDKHRHSMDYRLNEGCYFWSKIKTFTFVQDMERFQTRVESTTILSSWNPFPFRAFSISDGCLYRRYFGDNWQGDYWSKVEVFLEKFGVHIWHAEVDSCRHSALKCLALMPNMRSLVFSYDRYHDVQPLKMEQLDALPPLMYLVRLLIKAPFELAWKVMEAAEPTTLKQLEFLDSWDFETEKVVNRFGTLEELRVTQQSFFIPMTSFQKVTSLPLVVLEVGVQIASFTSLFEAVNKLGGSLKVLSLRLELERDIHKPLIYSGKDEQESLRFQLPRLQELKLESCSRRIVFEAVDFAFDLAELLVFQVINMLGSTVQNFRVPEEVLCQHFEKLVRFNFYQKSYTCCSKSSSSVRRIEQSKSSYGCQYLYKNQRLNRIERKTRKY